MRKLSLLLLLLLLLPGAITTSPSASNFSSEPVRYAVVNRGKVVGTQTSHFGPDGERRFFFEYSVRGRGPRLVSRIVLGPDRIPLSLETTGHDPLKNRVDETFSLAGPKAEWKNRHENSERRLAERAFYVSMADVPEETALLAQALLASPKGRLPLLPAGQAEIERVGVLKVRAGSETRTVSQYAIIGLDFTPARVWLDEDQNFFASHDGKIGVVREGWEASLGLLIDAQERAAAERTARLARSLAHRPAKPLVIQHATLFDAETGATRPGATVVVSGERIVAVGPDDRVALPAEAEFINARGKMLLPGLWDMHAHLNAIDGPLNIAAGVTTVRDLGTDARKLARLAREFDSGAEVGPRVIRAGLIDGSGPYVGPVRVFAHDAAEARELVHDYARRGYEQIKIYSSVRPDFVPAIIEEAKSLGMRVGGHVPATLTLEEAVRMGYDEVQHINFLFFNFLTDIVKDARRPGAFTALAENAAGVDPASPDVQRLIRLLRERNVVMDPTLNVFEAMFTDRRGNVSHGFAPVADRLPPNVRRGVMARGLPVPEGMDGRYRDSFAAMLKMTAALHDAGVPIVAGSDALAGFPLQRELELLVQAGIPAPEVLRIATLRAARIMKHGDDLGSIAAGKMADMLLVDGDPTSNISDIRRVVIVLKGGVVYHSLEVYRALGVRPEA